MGVLQNHRFLGYPHDELETLTSMCDDDDATRQYVRQYEYSRVASRPRAQNAKQKGRLRTRYFRVSKRLYWYGGFHKYS